MKIKLVVTAGPFKGREFEFDGHDTLLVGRTADAHLQLSFDDPYFSRRHFLVEVNPPRCRVIDLNSRNGTLKNGTRVQTAEVHDGDEIGAGHTVFKVSIVAPRVPEPMTLDLPVAPAVGLTADYHSFPPVSGYRIDSELGRGGMGVVYRARRDRDGQMVALKTIAPARKANRKQIDRFLRECRILADLNHPNIVGFREVGEAEGLLFLAMELVDGHDLAARLKANGPEHPRTAVRIICQVLGGLAHAHEKGFVHRDIKPANILIGRCGDKQVTKLADFGLARVYEASGLSGLTMQGEVGGTPWFMAPEQVTHYRRVKPAADQYSAAATLYRLLTNHNTHDFPKDIGAQLAHLVTEKPIPISDRAADLPPGLDAVLHKALSREPGHRYRNVTDFRGALKRFA
ncbi:MAG TPA: FHA domain-containing serine/threonine-protein kinase [Urbifossiella sp.]|nr:FHA domain-containing serine/threonine-protein kinase [Urbifossiella sp.]